jgi:sulfonate transport system substrate-binding protein
MPPTIPSTPTNRSAPPVRVGLDRRGFLQGVLGTAVLLGVSACAKDEASGSTTSTADAALPTSVPAGTELTISSPQSIHQLAFELSGLIDDFAFTVPEWPNVAAGPDVINAFRANSLELGRNAGIPPIQAHYQGLDVKIVGVSYHRKPIYVFATKPGSDIESVEDFEGKKLAFSQGQAQGVVLLRALDQAGIAYDDVELVPLTSNQFLTALQAGQVDIAPLGLSQVPQYLDEYGADGARTIETDVIDLLDILWTPASVLADEGKTAAIASFVPLWAQANVWIYENPQAWIDQYYVATQNLPADEAARVVELSGKPEFPPSWDDAIAWEQETIDLLAAGGFVDAFDAEGLFDRRFESLAADAVAAPYTTTDEPYEE